MSRHAVERYAEFVEAELKQERAAVLGRYGRRVEAALARCGVLASALGPDPEPVALVEYRAARRDVIDAISALCLQREVLGLLDHTWVERVYPAPPVR